MKNLLVLSALVLSTNSFASDYLLKYNVGSGFSPIPMSSETKVLEDGKVVRTVYQGTKTTTKLAKTLSPNTIQAIKDNIEALKANAKLVDLDANKPRCMDAPSRSITANKEGKEIRVYSVSTCHKSVVKSKAAENLIQAMETINASIK